MRNESSSGLTNVAPFAGAWIEIMIEEILEKVSGRTLRGCVD